MSHDFMAPVDLEPTPAAAGPSAFDWLLGTVAFILICCSPALVVACWRWAL